MIDEVAEVKQYLEGNGLEDSRNYYRACYMVAKYYKRTGMGSSEVFQRVAAWVRQKQLVLSFQLLSCVNAALSDPRELRCGLVVQISRTDVDTIRMYTATGTDRKVALALMCCAKGFAGSDGSFIASSIALGSWLGLDSGNIRGRTFKRLERYGYIERLPDTEIMRGWNKNYYRNASRIRLLVPYADTGEYTLRLNDIRSLYEQAFGEPY